jgi:hypothetical protein
MTNKHDRLGFTIGILIGVLGNFVVSFFVEAIKAIPAKHQESLPTWAWSILFIVFSLAFFYLAKTALREVFGAQILKRINIATVAFVITGVILIVTDVAGG